MSFRLTLLTLCLATWSTCLMAAKFEYQNEESTPLWLVKIYINFADVESVCEGALINSRWVLSAAHCFVRGDRRATKALVAFEALEQVLPWDSRQIIVHPNFSPITYDNDVALIQLDGKAPSILHKVEISRSCSFDLRHLQAFLTPSDGDSVEVSVSNLELCHQSLAALSVNHKICVESPVCSDLTGGPLLIRERREKLIGIASIKPPKCGFLVFTKVCDYLDWINGAMETALAIKSSKQEAAEAMFETKTLPRVGEFCQISEDCGGDLDKVYCKVISPTCGGGICSCFPGFKYQYQSGICVRSLKAGQNCFNEDECPFGSYCFNGTCVCAPPDAGVPYSESCLKEMWNSGNKAALNQPCGNNADCSGSLICRKDSFEAFTCGCGSRMTLVGADRCRPKTIFDECSTSVECSNVDYAVCTSGMCKCLTGYTPLTYQTSSTERTVTCISVEAYEKFEYVNEGGSCTMPGEGGLLCSGGMVCQSCGDLRGNICTRKLYQDAGSSAATTMPTAVSPVLFVVLGLLR